MSNPLVAGEVDSTTGYSGIGLVESAADYVEGIESGNWVEIGIGAVGVGLETLSIAMDPAGALLSYGIAWLIEHVDALSEALDWLAGNPDAISAHARTWGNVATAVSGVAQDFVTAMSDDTTAWHGTAAEAYRARGTDLGNLLAAAATAAQGIGAAVEMAGLIVATVREIVRDLIADLVSRLIVYAAELAATLGLTAPWVAAQATSLIARWAAKIADILSKLVRTISNLIPLLRNLDEIFSSITNAMGALRRSSRHTDLTPSPTTPAAAAPPTTTPSSAPDTSAPDTSAPTPTTPQATTTPSTPDAGSAPPATTPQSGSSPAPSATSTPSAAAPSGTTTPGGAAPGGSGAPDPPSRPVADGSLRGNTAEPRDHAVPADQRHVDRDPIDVATGEMVLSQTDVELPGSLALLLSRTHVSSYRVGRWFGPSWASTLDQRLEVDDQGVCYAGTDGVLLCYPTPIAGEPTLPQEGPRWPLARTDDGGYALSVPERGHTLHFPPPPPGQPARGLPLTAVTDRNNHRFDLDYDAEGTLTRIRHSGGYRIGVETASGRITALRLLGANLVLVRYSYDDAGRLSEVTNSSGVALRFDYDTAGRIIRWQDRIGTWYRYTYDAHGRCVATSGSNGLMDGTLTYDPDNRVSVVTNSLGHPTTFHLNELNQVIREVDPLGHATVSEWDRYDHLLARTDPLGRTTRFRYDEVGDLAEITRPDGSQIIAEYNDLRLPITVVDPDGAVWRRVYDERGNLTAVTNPAGARTTYTYDERGHLAAVTDAFGQARRVQTDDAGLPVTVTDPLGARTRYARDALGRVSAITDPVGEVTQLGWTVEGKLAWRKLPDGATERWRYDGEGNLIEHLDAVGHRTRTEVTHFDLPAVRTGPDGARLEFGYDTELRLVSVTNPQGLVWRYHYDPAGYLVRETDFNGRVLTYSHDAAGQLIERTNGAGQTTQLTRDLLGNVIEQHCGGTVTTFAYDPTGRLLHAMNHDAELTFERDPLGRVLAETCNGRTVNSSYDVVGRRVHRRTPSGAQSSWEYETSNQPVALHTGGHTLRFGYDAMGREVERQVGGVLLMQTWDANHRLRTQALTASVPVSGQPQPTHQARLVQRRSYVYRPDGQVTNILDQLTGLRRFDLNPAGRITAVHGSGWTERYTYDAAGNITHADWPAPPQSDSPDTDARGQREYTGTLIQRAGHVRYQHDAQGRVVLRQQKRLSAKPRTWHYTWDADDRLIGVVTPDGKRWRYRYDPLGRRIAKQCVATNEATVVEQVDFTWDGVVIAEQTRTGYSETEHSTTHRTTVWDFEPGTFRPVSQTERTPLRDAPQELVDEQFYAIITDLIGTPCELIKPDGTITWHPHTTLWGTIPATTPGDADCPLRFPGQYHDPETGLHYNNLRYYNPTTARYDTNDPLGLAPGPNPHTYVPNPTNWIDPLGLTPCSPIGFAPGEGVSALTPNRLQHGTRHLVDAGILPNWSGKNSPQLIRDLLAPILERPSATFDHILGDGTKVKGFLGDSGGQQIAVMIFKEGPYQGQLATAVVPSPNQLLKWGL